MVLESPAGERQRETLPAPSASFEAAVRLAAVHLARRGVAAAARLRVRAERAGTLSDDPALREIFLAALAREEAEEPWD